MQERYILLVFRVAHCTYCYYPDGDYLKSYLFWKLKIKANETE